MSFFSFDHPLLDKLYAQGLLKRDHIHLLNAEYERSHKSLEDLLIELEIIDEDTLTSQLSELQDIPRLDLSDIVLDTELLTAIPKEVCLEHLFIPIAKNHSELHFAISDTDNLMAYDHITSYFPQHKMMPHLASRNAILGAIDKYYDYETSLEGLLEELQSASTKNGANWESPIVRFVDALILEGIKNNASDIHCEPEATFIRIRQRIDGLLKTNVVFHKKHWTALVVRLKMMASMDIAENRRPQSGRLSKIAMGRKIDFRVSSHPTLYGENIVIRILDKQAALLVIDALGYTPETQEKIQAGLEKPEGLIVMTGPTGSGKTTSLYAMIAQLNHDNLIIMTLEEPIEYRIPRIRQTEIRENSGFTFAEGVRSILRQDPDVILIGEVRDPETAHMALRASMTGHKVLTTLHTPDAISALWRLQDLGVPPSMLAGHLKTLVAQRLLRQLCTACRLPYTIPSMWHETFKKGVNHWDPHQEIYHAQGCAACHHTGYQGRLAVAEVIVCDDAFFDLVLHPHTHASLRQHLAKQKFRKLWQEGIEKVYQGNTSLDELARVIELPQELRAHHKSRVSA